MRNDAEARLRRVVQVLSKVEEMRLADCEALRSKVISSLETSDGHKREILKTLSSGNIEVSFGASGEWRLARYGAESDLVRLLELQKTARELCRQLDEAQTQYQAARIFTEQASSVHQRALDDARLETHRRMQRLVDDLHGYKRRVREHRSG